MHGKTKRWEGEGVKPNHSFKMPLDLCKTPIILQNNIIMLIGWYAPSECIGGWSIPTKARIVKMQKTIFYITFFTNGIMGGYILYGDGKVIQVKIIGFIRKRGIFFRLSFFFSFQFPRACHLNSGWMKKERNTQNKPKKEKRTLLFSMSVVCVYVIFYCSSHPNPLSKLIVILVFFFYLFRLHRRICWASNKLSHSIVLLACLFGGLYVHLVFMLLVDCEWFVSRMLNQIKSTLKSNRNFHLVVIWIAIPIVVFIVFQAFSNHWFLPQSSPTIITYSIFK